MEAIKIADITILLDSLCVVKMQVSEIKVVKEPWRECVRSVIIGYVEVTVKDKDGA